jgi:hypothetical protein
MATNKFQWEANEEAHSRMVLISQLTKKGNKIKRAIVNILESKGEDADTKADEVFKAMQKIFPDKHVERGLVGGHLLNLCDHGFLIKIGYGHGSSYKLTDRYFDTKEYFLTYKQNF